MTRVFVLAGWLLIAPAYGADLAQHEAGVRDGDVRVLQDGAFLAWNAQTDEWQTPVAFWRSIQARGRGKNWGEGQRYPTYRDVSEHDSFLVHTVNGPCLMYFFHTRWRRANDVWRWGDEFNRYGGCPTVFD